MAQIDQNCMRQWKKGSQDSKKDGVNVHIPKLKKEAVSSFTYHNYSVSCHNILKYYKPYGSAYDNIFWLLSGVWHCLFLRLNVKKFSVLKTSETLSRRLAEEHLESFTYMNINCIVLQCLDCDEVCGSTVGRESLAKLLIV